MAIKIDYDKCCWKDGKCTSRDCCSSDCGSTCVGCVEACPVQALSRKKKVVVDKKKCLSCGACISACKHGALSLE